MLEPVNLHVQVPESALGKLGMRNCGRVIASLEVHGQTLTLTLEIAELGIDALIGARGSGDQMCVRHAQRDSPIDRLRSTLTEWSTPPTLAMLFGSVARGEATSASDLDLLIIRPRAIDADHDVWRTQLIDVERSATAWTGNDTRVVEYGEDELGGLPEEPLLGDVLDDGIELVGTRRALKRTLANGRTG
jgi:hypothetical protein